MGIVKIAGILGFLYIVMSISIDKSNIRNFHKVNDELYRSGQTNRNGMQHLENLGIHSVVNLRYSFDDKNELKGTSLHRIRVKMKAKKINKEDIIHALIAINKADKPTLIHCYHGSDRTGCVVAAYRMVFENWSKENAISEFRKEEYGYNHKLFPNILALLEELDIEMVKNAVFANQ